MPVFGHLSDILFFSMLKKDQYWIMAGVARERRIIYLTYYNNHTKSILNINVVCDLPEIKQKSNKINFILVNSTSYIHLYYTIVKAIGFFFHITTDWQKIHVLIISIFLFITSWSINCLKKYIINYIYAHQFTIHFQMQVYTLFSYQSKNGRLLKSWLKMLEVYDPENTCNILKTKHILM